MGLCLPNRGEEQVGTGLASSWWRLLVEELRVSPLVLDWMRWSGSRSGLGHRKVREARGPCVQNWFSVAGDVGRKGGCGVDVAATGWS